MRILLITDNHTVSGGAELYFFDLKKHLNQLPHTQVLSIGFADKKQHETDAIIFKACRSNLAKLFWRFFIQPFLYWQLRKTIRQFKPDVIHIHNVKQYTATLFAALRHYTIVQTVHDYSLLCPVGYNVHSDYSPCGTGFTWKCFWQHKIRQAPLTYLLRVLAMWRMQSQVRSRVHKLIAPSPHLRSDLLLHGFADVVYIPPFLQPANYQSFTDAVPLQFLFAANLGTHKGIYLLLEEFALACKKMPNLTLLIAGSGPEQANMQRFAENLNISNNIQFLGWQSNLTPYYQQSTAILFTSICIESFGMVVTEAMSHGRAVIGCNRGPTAWLIENEKTGLLFNPTLKGDLAAKILLLANNPMFAEQLGKEAHHKMQRFIDNEHSLQRVLNTYQDAIASH